MQDHEESGRVIQYHELLWRIFNNYASSCSGVIMGNSGDTGKDRLGKGCVVDNIFFPVNIS